MISKEIIGKTIKDVTEGYEPFDGVRVWQQRIHFTDGTSVAIFTEVVNDGDREIVMEYQE